MTTGATREEAYYEMFHGTAHVVLGSGLTIAGATYCLTFTRMPYFQTLGVPCAVGILAGVAVALTLGSRDHHHRQPLRSLRTQALDAHPVLEADRDDDRAVAGTDPDRVVGVGPHRPGRPARDIRPTTTTRKFIPKDIAANVGFEAANRHFSMARMNPEVLTDRG